MERRKFLTFIGATAAAGSGVAATRFPWNRPQPNQEFDLADAAGPPDGDRAGMSRLIWSVKTDEPTVAFTFDDGPHPDLTPKVLDVLDEFDVKATFNVMGYNANEHPELLMAAVVSGHEIGNHTWTHLDLGEQPADTALRELQWGHEAITAIAGITPKIFRPPRGRLSGAAARYAAQMDYDIVLWSVGRGVYGRGTPDEVTRHVVGSLHPGDIIGLHDGIGREGLRTDLEGPGPSRNRRDVEIAALRDIVEQTLERGFRITTVSELLRTATEA